MAVQADPSWDMKLSSRHCGGATPAPQRKPCASTSIRSPTSSSTGRPPFVMDDNLRHQRDTSLVQLEALTRRGHQIRNTPAADATRAWQQDCAAAINQLSGGSKAHWLARAYSDAFLVRSARGGVVVEVEPTEIVDRILGVLAQGATSLSRMDDVAASSGAAPRPRQFEFVHNAELRPVLEQTFADSRDALERGEFGLALVLSCGVIEAVLTDALDCARLPPVARKYRDLTDADGELRVDAPVSEREARLAGQVLHVVMRDLDPGR